ncbi:MAG: HAD family phosphatase [Candidatus Schekmanbacteria bacterium]|nr:HAD family phosphatase [Candidatus Schekmanbacteria bacterium]
MRTESIDACGVIFDMDGVLVDSAAAHLAAWQRLGDEVGEPFSEELFRSTFGMHNNQIVPSWLGRAVSEAEVAALATRKESLYRGEAARCVRAIPGAVALVRVLAAGGWRLAVGSSGPRANVELLLSVIGVAGLFAGLATGDEVREGKPHPEIFLIAARLLGLAPARCLVIEDAPQGITAARRAGCPVIAVATTHDARELGDANAVLSGMEQVDATIIRAVLDC